MKKTIISIVLVALVVGAGSFYGGMKYAQSKSSASGTARNFQNLSDSQRQQLFASGGAVTRSGQTNGGFTSGEVIAKDDKSITVKLADGGSKIIFYSSSTQIRQMADGTINDVSTGTQITVNGSANQDGSLTAQTIQIRPADVNPNQNQSN